MKENINFLFEMNTETIKAIFIILYTYCTSFRIVNKKIEIKFKFIKEIFIIIMFSILCGIMKYKINYLISIISSILIISIITFKNDLKYGIIITTVAMGVNYIMSYIAVIIDFILIKFIKIESDIVNLLIIILIHIILVNCFFKIKKLKYGISFLRTNKKDGYLDLFILNISAIILFLTTILVNSDILDISNIVFGILTFSIIMFITIQKSLQLYYKQKLLAQELEETKKELENKKEELQNVEKENINISKKNHTLAHKQKSLEHKIEEMINKSEVSKEEAEELKRRLKEIGKDLYKEKETIELDKTGIPEIDDMMKYMQSECKKNKIEFEYQLKGNIYYMTNNLVSKEDLETLLADHIKNAIIAINHTNNLNRSILVRLGKIDENYGLYIYDSGIEFKPEIFEKLGKEPSTTHPDEGGTGMGFMNTFDTLRKYNASLTIEEYDKPNKDNYTKVLIIKFDGKKEFKIKSYQLKETIKIG